MDGHAAHARTHEQIQIATAQIKKIGNYGPAHNTFTAIYFTLTGLHGLHVLAGMVIMLKGENGKNVITRAKARIAAMLKLLHRFGNTPSQRLASSSSWRAAASGSRCTAPTRSSITSGNSASSAPRPIPS